MVFFDIILQVTNDLTKSDKNQAQQASWIETKNNAIAEMTGKISSFQEQMNTKVDYRFYKTKMFFLYIE